MINLFFFTVLSGGSGFINPRVQVIEDENDFNISFNIENENEDKEFNIEY